MDFDIFESKLVSLWRPFTLEFAVDLPSERLKHLFADLETDIEFCLFTMILMVRPGIAGVGAIPLTN